MRIFIKIKILLILNMNIIILIIASNNSNEYIEMQNIWRKYMNNHPNIKSFFIKNDLNIDTDIYLNENLNTIYTKDIETYGTIYLTDAGREFIQSPTSFMLIKERTFNVDEHPEDNFVSAGKGGAFDEALFDMLIDLRKSLSKQKNIPPFVIFQEPSLKEMCFHYPITMDELTNIQGVGTGKASRYGAPFLSLIQNYVDENEIERPQDLVVKSIINKSGLKVQLIQNIDRKLPLEDIGKAQGKSLEEVIEEIEAIVSSGTRVNINYYINDILDQDNQEEIYDYFNDAETDDIDLAVKEFDGDYSEEELRLMRIKFMSEMAN